MIYRTSCISIQFYFFKEIWSHSAFSYFIHSFWQLFKERGVGLYFKFHDSMGGAYSSGGGGAGGGGGGGGLIEGGRLIEETRYIIYFWEETHANRLKPNFKLHDFHFNLISDIKFDDVLKWVLNVPSPQTLSSILTITIIKGSHSPKLPLLSAGSRRSEMLYSLFTSKGLGRWCQAVRFRPSIADLYSNHFSLNELLLQSHLAMNWELTGYKREPLPTGAKLWLLSYWERMYYATTPTPTPPPHGILTILTTTSSLLDRFLAFWPVFVFWKTFGCFLRWLVHKGQKNKLI